MTFKIATWNVNSLNVRLSQVVEWLEMAKPDVLALQETKMLDEKFPVAELTAAGYHAVFSGQKTYNGVAILSRQPGKDKFTDLPSFTDPQRRLLGITLGPIRILNLYVPNGESIISEKYKYKLSWLEKLKEHLTAELKQHSQLIVLGDFNVAPENEDVHDPAEWAGSVLFSDPERAALKALMTLGLTDCFRLYPQPEKSFSWWDYRMNSFKRNRGLRIDHILVSQNLATKCIKCAIDKNPREHERPSDHAPVIAEFQL